MPRSGRLLSLLAAGCLALALPAAAGLSQSLVREFVPDPSHGADGPRFPTGRGVRLDDVGVKDHYTIEISFQFDEVDGYRKILDFKDRKSDDGLYVYNGQLLFYPVIPHPGWLGPYEEVVPTLPPLAPVFHADTEYRLRLHRERASGVVHAYLDGNWPAFEFVDRGNLAVFSTPTAYFFVDDAATRGEEASGGRVSRIRIWDSPPTELACEGACGAESRLGRSGPQAGGPSRRGRFFSLPTRGSRMGTPRKLW